MWHEEKWVFEKNEKRIQRGAEVRIGKKRRINYKGVKMKKLLLAAIVSSMVFGSYAWADLPRLWGSVEYDGGFVAAHKPAYMCLYPPPVKDPDVDRADTVTFRVMTYNALNFSWNDGNRADYFETIFDSTNVDVILMQEMVDEAGCDTLLNRLNSDSTEFARAQFINGYGTDNILFYRTSKCSLLSQDTIQTDLRDISEYVLRINENEIKLYSCHLKAGQGSSNEQLRLEEITKLRNWLNDSIPAGTEFVVVGDMNFYYDEPAYYKLIDSTSNNNGRCKDPLEQPGIWHDNIVFAPIHTQSPRDSVFGGGATGGLDDRFDFIFIRYDLNNDLGVEYIESSYRAYGNDGNHFNQAVNAGTNDSVSAFVADALFEASDHLPVYADFISVYPVAVTEIEKNHLTIPFVAVNSISHKKFKIVFELIKRSKVYFDIYNALGQKVKSIHRLENAGRHEMIWAGNDSNNNKMSSAVYFLRFKIGKYEGIRKLILLN